MAATRAGNGRPERSGVPSPGGPGTPAAGATDSIDPALTKGRVRVVVEDIRPRVDDGRFPAKREVGDVVEVSADVFADGHDQVTCELRWRGPDGGWSSTPMAPLGNDRFRGTFEVSAQGRYRFCLRASVDPYATWVRDTMVKLAAGRDVTVELLVGAELLQAAAARAKGKDRTKLELAQQELRQAADSGDLSDALAAASTPERQAFLRRFPDPDTVVSSEAIQVAVERRRARFSAWYEMFPRSASPEPGRHGTLADVERRLEYVAAMGFDVVYLPPIHPIGRVNRKGRDGAPAAEPGDPGSPWAIGAEEGGHTAVHPELGTLDDVRRLVRRAHDLGMEVALDFAVQCAPDHPWVKEHPEWFRWLPDGTIRFAENPPKRYEDIYPVDFDAASWPELWGELLETVRFWIRAGVRIFRVDNPHTKPLRMWEWLIAAVKAEEPDVLFLSEAFTRPALMYRLAKIGFSQSYTYFAWRNAKWELEQYLTELHRTEVADFFRPNLWPNTPDILTEALQRGGRPAFMARLVLAATGAASYGIYGPPFELQEHEARHEGSEEYLHSEKYEVRHWDLGARHSLSGFITRVNEIRRANPALQYDRNLRLHDIDNDALLVYSRTWGTSRILVVVNLDPYYRQSGFTNLDMDALGLPWDDPYVVHDLLTDARYTWQGNRNFVQLDPASVPAHVLRVEALAATVTAITDARPGRDADEVTSLSAPAAADGGVA